MHNQSINYQDIIHTDLAICSLVEANRNKKVEINFVSILDASDSKFDDDDNIFVYSLKQRFFYLDYDIRTRMETDSEIRNATNYLLIIKFY